MSTISKSKKEVTMEKPQQHLCKLCQGELESGILSSKGLICYSCADTIKEKHMAKIRGEVEGVKGEKTKREKRAPKAVTLRERGIGPNLCINIPTKDNEKLMDAIDVFRQGYKISLNNLLFVALGKYLKIKVKLED